MFIRFGQFKQPIGISGAATKKNEVLSLIIGPSTLSLLVIKPIPADPVNFFLLPSRSVTSNTDDRRPPNFSGMLLLYKFNVFYNIGVKCREKTQKSARGYKWWHHQLIIRF
jgi:hypothetical protein